MNVFPIEKTAFKSLLTYTHERAPNYVSCGFPSPAESVMEKPLSLDEKLIEHPNATYFVRASGESMKDIGILDGAILIVDRSLQAQHNNVVIAAIDGELTCKILNTINNTLVAANPDYSPIPVSVDDELIIQGVVTHAINKL